MFAITVAFGAQSWRLLYKTQEPAEAAWTLLSAPESKVDSFTVPICVSVVDDFGQRAHIKLNAIVGLMFENLDESKLGSVEWGLHQQRTQLSFQQRAENDPTIRAAAAMRGPAVISPMGNGRGFS